MKHVLDKDTQEWLKNQGWFPERHIDVIRLLRTYEQKGFYCDAHLIQFLSSFGEMTLKLPGKHKLYVEGPGTPIRFSKREAQLIWHHHGIFLTPFAYEPDYDFVGYLYGSDGKVYMYINLIDTIDTYTDSLAEFVVDCFQNAARHDHWLSTDDLYTEDLQHERFKIPDFWEDLDRRYELALAQSRPPLPSPATEPEQPQTTTFSEAVDLHLRRDHWFPGRQVDIGHLDSHFERFDLFGPEKVLDFLSGFHHLQLNRCASPFQLSWRIEPDVPAYDHSEHNHLHLLYAHLKKPVAPVGFSADQFGGFTVQYNLFMDAEGKFYRYDDAQEAFYAYGDDTRAFLETVYGVHNHSRLLIGVRALRKALDLEDSSDLNIQPRRRRSRPSSNASADLDRLRDAYVQAVRSAIDDTSA